jgi:hypothetical protein
MINGTWVSLGRINITAKGNWDMLIKPIDNTVFIRILGPFTMQIKRVCIKKPVQVEETYLVDLCSGLKDRYRFGFNGQEKVNEWSGIGNFNEFLFRGYDSRTARFLSVDPLAKKYPWNSPFSFAENRVIDGVDLEGREFYSVHINEAPDGKRSLVGIVNYTNIPQQGMTNIPTKDGVGPQGDVGVNYTITKVDDKGNTVNRSGFNLKNFYGVYNGPNNPKKYWESPDADGNYPDDYNLPPIDEEDLNGFVHDKDFDALDLRGLPGVMDNKSTPANEAYRKRAANIVAKQKKGEKDVVTGKPVTKKAAKAAHKYAEEGFKSFKTAEDIKKGRENVDIIGAK